jgi:hypothetical protein
MSQPDNPQQVSDAEKRAAGLLCWYVDSDLLDGGDEFGTWDDEVRDCVRSLRTDLAYADHLGVTTWPPLRCPECHLAFEGEPGQTLESLAAECGMGHHADTDDGCPDA